MRTIVVLRANIDASHVVQAESSRAVDTLG